MSDNVFILSVYKNYSLDLLNSSIYFFFACIVAGNFSICLSKLSSSGIISSFIGIIDDILDEIFKAEEGVYNPYDKTDRDKKIKEIFGKYLINDFTKLDKSNTDLSAFYDIGSTKSVKFDLVVNKKLMEEEYYLVYYKLTEKYVESIIKSLYSALHGRDGYWFLISFLFRYFLLTSLRIVNIYLFILSMCNEHVLLLFFSLPFSVLKYIYGLVTSCITFGYIFYLILYLFEYFYVFFNNYYSAWKGLFDKINDPIKGQLTKLSESYILIFWVGFLGFWTVILQLWIIFFFILGFIIATCVLLALMSIYIILNLFFFLFTLIRIGFFSTRGFFVEECEPPYKKTNDIDTIYTFKGTKEFTLQSSFVYTYLKYTLWYYLLYVIFIVFPVTQKIFGVNVIVPFIIFTIIGYIIISRGLAKLQEQIMYNNNTVHAQNAKGMFEKNPSYAQAILSYFSSPKK